MRKDATREVYAIGGTCHQCNVTRPGGENGKKVGDRSEAPAITRPGTRGDRRCRQFPVATVQPTIGPVEVFQALAGQDKDAEMKARFEKVAKDLSDNEDKINAELLAAQGEPMDVGGYYLPDDDLAEKAMRPSPTFNAIIDGMA